MADFLRLISMPLVFSVSLAAGLYRFGWSLQVAGVMTVCLILSLALMWISAQFGERGINAALFLLSAAVAAALTRFTLGAHWLAGVTMGASLPWCLMLAIAGLFLWIERGRNRGDDAT